MYESVTYYLNCNIEIIDDEIKGNKVIVDKLQKFQFSQNEIHSMIKISKRNLVFSISTQINVTQRKFILKAMDFNISETQDIKEKELALHRNKNLFKELRIIRNTSSRFINKCKGYFINEHEKRIYLVYEHFDHSLENFIRNKTFDFENKIKFFKTLLELVKMLHCSGIISMDLSVKNIFFTNKFALKIAKFIKSINTKTNYDLDRLFTFTKDHLNIFTAPEIYLNNFSQISWQSSIWSLGVTLSMLFSDRVFDINPLENYKQDNIPDILHTNIENIYAKSIIIGILRLNPIERPTIFEIIDTYNSFISKLNLGTEYNLLYSTQEVLSKILLLNLAFTKFFHNPKPSYIVHDLDTSTKMTISNKTNDRLSLKERFSYTIDDSSKYQTGLISPFN